MLCTKANYRKRLIGEHETIIALPLLVAPYDRITVDLHLPSNPITCRLKKYQTLPENGVRTVFKIFPGHGFNVVPD